MRMRASVTDIFKKSKWLEDDFEFLKGFVTKSLTEFSRGIHENPT